MYIYLFPRLIAYGVFEKEMVQGVIWYDGVNSMISCGLSGIDGYGGSYTN